MKILKIIYLYFLNSLQIHLASPVVFVMFFLSKIFRFGLFIVFLYFLGSSLVSVGDYSVSQLLLFYLIFNLVDTAAQMLFREVYRFRPQIISGGFDLVLAKPFPALLRVLVGGPDFIDLGILLVLLAVIAYTLAVHVRPDPVSLLIFILLLINSLILAAAFHIFVLGFGILTLSVDHLVMIYRDFTALMRIPVDFFPGTLRALLTFVVPVGIMFTFPAKALLALLDWPLIFIALSLGLLALFLSLRFWNFALKHYQSASS